MTANPVLTAVAVMALVALVIGSALVLLIETWREQDDRPYADDLADDLADECPDELEPLEYAAMPAWWVPERTVHMERAPSVYDRLAHAEEN